ncbi:hypothetical protein LZ30DRAFT_476854 [Colletotrichum cereale]|nr:hypothetical protein LZ30DRAFT_476854 [Colletotrichum cereale]
MYVPCMSYVCVVKDSKRRKHSWANSFPRLPCSTFPFLFCALPSFPSSFLSASGRPPHLSPWPCHENTSLPLRIQAPAWRRFVPGPHTAPGGPTCLPFSTLRVYLLCTCFGTDTGAANLYPLPAARFEKPLLMSRPNMPVDHRLGGAPRPAICPPTRWFPLAPAGTRVW